MRPVSKWAMSGAALITTVLIAAPVQAQPYPSQDIHFVVGFVPGSGADVLTRFFAEKLQQQAKRTVVVENKVGAAGNIATEAVARAKPDGYTILLGAGSAIAAGMHLTKNPPVDVVKSFLIAATINKQAFLLSVAASSPYKSIAELTTAMKAKGANASYATTAPTGIVMGEMYKATAGLQTVEVRYRAANDALNEFASGKLDYGAMDPVFALAQQREGRLRVLAHSSGQKIEAVGSVPSMAEAGVPGMNLTSWWALHVPMGTPKPVVDQLNAWMKTILEQPDTKAFLNNFGGDPFISTPEDAQKLFVEDEKNWKDYVRIAKIDPQ